MTTAERVLEEARMEFCIRAPYLATAMFALSPFSTTDIPTFAVTQGMVMLYNPEYVMRLYQMPNGLLKVTTRIWHEVGHIVRDTFTRLPGVDDQRRNIVSDLAINSSGLPGGWDFGPDGLLPSRYNLPDGKTMEEYHALLPQNAKVLAGWGGSCGSGAGNAMQEEALAGKQERPVEEVEAIKSQVANDIITYNGKNPGKVPGSMVEWAKLILKPSKVPWTKVLYNDIRQVTGAIKSGGAIDVSYRHPSPRSYIGPPGLLKPGDIEYEIEIALVLDSSGSMDMRTCIQPALREGRAALQASGVHAAWWLEVDANLTAEPRRVRVADLEKLPIHGRGGTDFRPGFEIASKLNPRPNLIIYLTDGLGPAPESPPRGISTIWLLVGPHAQAPTPWGRRVFVKD